MDASATLDAVAADGGHRLRTVIPHDDLVLTCGDEIAELVADLTPEDARTIAAAARAHILAHHTWERRVREVDALLEGRTQRNEAAA
jgi:hypothetical protein